MVKPNPAAFAIAVAAMLGASPVMAQIEGLAEIEAMVDEAATPEGALSAAQAQAVSGDVSMAATTLERALISDPDNIAARATYVSYLCQLDDRQAALFEIGKLSGLEVPQAAWSKIEASCGPTPRPTQKTKG